MRKRSAKKRDKIRIEWLEMKLSVAQQDLKEVVLCNKRMAERESSFHDALAARELKNKTLRDFNYALSVRIEELEKQLKDRPALAEPKPTNRKSSSWVGLFHKTKSLRTLRKRIKRA